MITAKKQFQRLDELRQDLAWLVEKSEKMNQQIERVQAEIQKIKGDLGIKNNNDLLLLDKVLLKKETIN